jgi:RNA polymerase sigma-70 factor (ECF subfamily)
MAATPPSLLEKVRQTSDQQAWSRFVWLYTPLLQRWLARLGVGADEAGDLIQDVFVILVRKLPEFSYDREKSFRAWLRTVLLNRWRDRRRHQVPLPIDDESPALANLEVEGPAELFDQAEYHSYLTSRALHLIQTDFPEPTWQAFWQVVVAERPAAEVAAALGTTVNAVYLAKGRVLRRLRVELDGLLD